MGAYENPQLGMIDYSLGQRAFQTAFNNMYSVFNNYYSNLNKERKEIFKRVDNTWDPSKVGLQNSQQLGEKATERVFQGGNDARNYFMANMGQGQQQARRQFGYLVEGLNGLVQRAFIDIEAYDSFDKSDPGFEQYQYINELITNGKTDIKFDFIPLGEKPGLGHKWFDGGIILSDSSGKKINNKKYGIENGFVSLDKLQSIYSKMDQNKVDYDSYLNNKTSGFNLRLTNKVNEIKTKTANDKNTKTYNTLPGYLHEGVNSLLITEDDYEKYYSNFMNPTDRMTGGSFEVIDDETKSLKGAVINVGGKEYELPKEFFSGNITKEKITAMFNETKIGGFDSGDGIQPQEQLFIDTAIEYKNNVARAHLWRRLAIGQVNPIEPETVIDPKEPRQWEVERAQAFQNYKLNERTLYNYMIGDESNKFIGKKIGSYEIISEDFDQTSGELDFVLKTGIITSTTTAKQAWGNLTVKERAAFDSFDAFEESYIQPPKKSKIQTIRASELRNNKKYLLHKENDINNLLTLLSDDPDMESPIRTAIEKDQNFLNILAGHIKSTIMNNAKLFDSKINLPTQKGWDEIASILPKHRMGDAVTRVNLSPEDKNALAKIIRQLVAANK